MSKSTDYFNYATKCLDNIGVKYADSVNHNNVTDKHVIWIKNAGKCEIWFNPKGDEKCRISMYLANGSVYEGLNVKVHNRKNIVGVNATTEDVAAAMECIKRYLDMVTEKTTQDSQTAAKTA